MKYCQKCGTQLESDAEFCSKCGQAVADIDKVATKFCTNCGTKIPATANFCTNCGTEITKTQAATAQPASSPVASAPAISRDKPYNENVQPDPINSFDLFFKDTFHISKRLGRADYWWARLTSIVGALSLGLLWLTGTVHSIDGGSTADSIFVVVLLIATIVLGVWYLIALITADIRRLHDIGLSGAFIFLLLLPSIGSLVIFIMTLLPSKQTGNRYAN